MNKTFLLDMENVKTSGGADIISKNEGKNIATDIKCLTCNTEFSHADYYRKHLGTKKHKRNQRSQRKEMLDRENSWSQPTDNRFEDKPYYRAVREKYWQRKIKNYENNYTSYVWSLTAYWASVLAVNPTVRDIKISLDDKKWGDFGDAVIEIEFIDYPGKANVTKTYAVLFKHIISNNFRNIDNVSEGSFNVKNVISKLARIKVKEEDMENIKFVVYTTVAISPALDINKPVNIGFCSACRTLEHRCICQKAGKSDIKQKSTIQEVPVYIKPFSARTKNIIDSSDDTQSIYYFHSSNKNFVLPKIYFYTSQRRPRYFPASIDELFFDGSINLSRELIKYVENWSSGKNGGTYKLTKEDVLVKLGHLLLSKFIVTPKVKPMIPQNAFDVWEQAIDKAHLIVLKDPVNLSEICEPMHLVIERELGVKIDVVSESVRLLRATEKNDIDKITNPILKAYIFEESPDCTNIPIEKVFLMFWKAGLIPLILQVNNLKDQEYVLQVINLLKSFGLYRRYFLKTSDVNIKTYVQGFKNLSYFVSLDDVAENLDPSIFDKVKIRVTDGFSLSLKTIRETDEFFQKSISANEFFDMALGKYVFKPSSGYLTGSFAAEFKLTLSDHQIKTLRKEVESKMEFSNVFKKECTTQNKWLRGIDPNLFG